MNFALHQRDFGNRHSGCTIVGRLIFTYHKNIISVYDSNLVFICEKELEDVIWGIAGSAEPVLECFDKNNSNKYQYITSDEKSSLKTQKSDSKSICVEHNTHQLGNDFKQHLSLDISSSLCFGADGQVLGENVKINPALSQTSSNCQNVIKENTSKPLDCFQPVFLNNERLDNDNDDAVNSQYDCNPASLHFLGSKTTSDENSTIPREGTHVLDSDNQSNNSVIDSNNRMSALHNTVMDSENQMSALHNTVMDSINQSNNAVIDSINRSNNSVIDSDNQISALHNPNLNSSNQSNVFNDPNLNSSNQLSALHNPHLNSSNQSDNYVIDSDNQLNDLHNPNLNSSNQSNNIVIDSDNRMNAFHNPHLNSSNQSNVFNDPNLNLKNRKEPLLSQLVKKSKTSCTYTLCVLLNDFKVVIYEYNDLVFKIAGLKYYKNHIKTTNNPDHVQSDFNLAEYTTKQLPNFKFTNNRLFIQLSHRQLVCFESKYGSSTSFLDFCDALDLPCVIAFDIYFDKAVYPNCGKNKRFSEFQRNHEILLVNETSLKSENFSEIQRNHENSGKCDEIPGKSENFASSLKKDPKSDFMKTKDFYFPTHSKLSQTFSQALPKDPENVPESLQTKNNDPGQETVHQLLYQQNPQEETNSCVLYLLSKDLEKVILSSYIYDFSQNTTSSLDRTQLQPNVYDVCVVGEGLVFFSKEVLTSDVFFLRRKLMNGDFGIEEFYTDLDQRSENGFMVNSYRNQSSVLNYKEVILNDIERNVIDSKGVIPNENKSSVLNFKDVIPNELESYVSNSKEVIPKENVTSSSNSKGVIPKENGTSVSNSEEGIPSSSTNADEHKFTSKYSYSLMVSHRTTLHMLKTIHLFFIDKILSYKAFEDSLFIFTPNGTFQISLCFKYSMLKSYKVFRISTTAYEFGYFTNEMMCLGGDFVDFCLRHTKSAVYAKEEKNRSDLQVHAITNTNDLNIGNLHSDIRNEDIRESDPYTTNSDFGNEDSHKNNDMYENNDIYQNNDIHQNNASHKNNDIYENNDIYQNNDSYKTNDSQKNNDLYENNDIYQNNAPHKNNDIHKNNDSHKNKDSNFEEILCAQEPSQYIIYKTVLQRSLRNYSVSKLLKINDQMVGLNQNKIHRFHNYYNLNFTKKYKMSGYTKFFIHENTIVLSGRTKSHFYSITNKKLASKTIFSVNIPKKTFKSVWNSLLMTFLDCLPENKKDRILKLYEYNRDSYFDLEKTGQMFMNNEFDLEVESVPQTQPEPKYPLEDLSKNHSCMEARSKSKIDLNKCSLEDSSPLCHEAHSKSRIDSNKCLFEDLQKDLKAKDNDSIFIRTEKTIFFDHYNDQYIQITPRKIVYASEITFSEEEICDCQKSHIDLTNIFTKILMLQNTDILRILTGIPHKCLDFIKKIFECLSGHDLDVRNQLSSNVDMNINVIYVLTKSKRLYLVGHKSELFEKFAVFMQAMVLSEFRTEQIQKKVFETFLNVKSNDSYLSNQEKSGMRDSGQNSGDGHSTNHEKSEIQNSNRNSDDFHFSNQGKSGMSDSVQNSDDVHFTNRNIDDVEQKSIFNKLKALFMKHHEDIKASIIDLKDSKNNLFTKNSHLVSILLDENVSCFTTDKDTLHYMKDNVVQKFKNLEFVFSSKITFSCKNPTRNIHQLDRGFLLLNEQIKTLNRFIEILSVFVYEAIQDSLHNHQCNLIGSKKIDLIQSFGRILNLNFMKLFSETESTYECGGISDHHSGILKNHLFHLCKKFREYFKDQEKTHIQTNSKNQNTQLLDSEYPKDTKNMNSEYQNGPFLYLVKNFFKNFHRLKKMTFTETIDFKDSNHHKRETQNHFSRTTRHSSNNQQRSLGETKSYNSNSEIARHSSNSTQMFSGETKPYASNSEIASLRTNNPHMFSGDKKRQSSSSQALDVLSFDEIESFGNNEVLVFRQQTVLAVFRLYQNNLITIKTDLIKLDPTVKNFIKTKLNGSDVIFISKDRFLFYSKGRVYIHRINIDLIHIKNNYLLTTNQFIQFNTKSHFDLGCCYPTETLEVERKYTDLIFNNTLQVYCAIAQKNTFCKMLAKDEFKKDKPDEGTDLRKNLVEYNDTKHREITFDKNAKDTENLTILEKIMQPIRENEQIQPISSTVLYLLDTKFNILDVVEYERGWYVTKLDFCSLNDSKKTEEVEKSLFSTFIIVTLNLVLSEEELVRTKLSLYEMKNIQLRSTFQEKQHLQDIQKTGNMLMKTDLSLKNTDRIEKNNSSMRENKKKCLNDTNELIIGNRCEKNHGHITNAAHFDSTYTFDKEKHTESKNIPENANVHKTVTKKGLKHCTTLPIKSNSLYFTVIRGYLAVAQGTRLLVYKFDRLDGLTAIAFFDLNVICVCVDSIKNYLLVGDIDQGIEFFYFQSKPIKLVRLSKSSQILDLAYSKIVEYRKSITFFENREKSKHMYELLFICTHKNFIKAFSYHPNNSFSQFGNRLIKVINANIFDSIIRSTCSDFFYSQTNIYKLRKTDEENISKKLRRYGRDRKKYHAKMVILEKIFGFIDKKMPRLSMLMKMVRKDGMDDIFVNPILNTQALKHIWYLDLHAKIFICREFRITLEELYNLI